MHWRHLVLGYSPAEHLGLRLWGDKEHPQLWWLTLQYSMYADVLQGQTRATYATYRGVVTASRLFLEALIQPPMQTPNARHSIHVILYLCVSPV